MSDFRRISEVAKFFEAEEAAVLEWGAQGLLKIATNIGKAMTPPSSKHSPWVNVLPRDLQLLALHGEAHVEEFASISNQQPVFPYEGELYCVISWVQAPPLGGKAGPQWKRKSLLLKPAALLVFEDEFNRFRADFGHQIATTSTQKQLDPRSENSDLHIIGALLETIKELDRELPDNKRRFCNGTETEIRKYIGKKYRGFYGCSPRTLADRFKLAKDSLEE
ncbi:hypothetical protein [Desulfurivibrio alkaliphilus]|uniref:Uncharacterized protein n=1 Tax=Desulfurivibrio alkaliphilus (strain DSM 19089 / UNIQEM U267 / AHT2) TaxID=589865 RepID=D6Z5I2_DESAT|nr:hypothetical protein [Desulfurivibrio alkaliphilus]ADH86719.1 hypothetical protein DaAHT2_2045 [Desulfurivibrio alkaliphilus AHT 2]